jgi:general secretion pathway protein L
MSDTLLIHYNIENRDHASWALCNDVGELTSKISSGSLAELHAISSSHISIVLLNSQCLHINELQLPTQNMQKMLKAVPYAIEDFIADDIENFHFVASKNKASTSSNTTCVVGIDKTTLQAVIDQFQQANIFIEKIIPDALCLAANEQQWAALNFNDHSYLQTNQLSGMVIPHDVLPYILENKLNDETCDKPEKLLLFCEAENSTAFDVVTFDDTAIERINITYNMHPLVIFAGNYKQALPLNLLQHDFKPKSKSAGYWKHWRLAATLAGSWLLLHLGVTAFQYNQLEEENIATKNKLVKTYKTAFPKSRKINNPRRQMEQKLKALKSASGNATNGLLFMLEETFSGLTEETKDITFQSFTFRNNRMDIGLESKTLQAIETLNKKLNTSKTIKSEIISSSSEKNIVKGNLRIEARQ